MNKPDEMASNVENFLLHDYTVKTGEIQHLKEQRHSRLNFFITLTTTLASGTYVTSQFLVDKNSTTTLIFFVALSLSGLGVYFYLADILAHIQFIGLSQNLIRIKQYFQRYDQLDQFLREEVLNSTIIRYKVKDGISGFNTTPFPFEAGLIFFITSFSYWATMGSMVILLQDMSISISIGVFFILLIVPLPLLILSTIWIRKSKALKQLTDVLDNVSISENRDEQKAKNKRAKRTG